MAKSERADFFVNGRILEPISRHRLCALLQTGYSTVVREVLSRDGIRLELQRGRISPDQANLIIERVALARKEKRIPPTKTQNGQNINL